MKKPETVKVGLCGQKSYRVPVEAAQILRLDARHAFQQSILRNFRERCKDRAATRALCESLYLAWHE